MPISLYSLVTRFITTLIIHFLNLKVSISASSHSATFDPVLEWNVKLNIQTDKGQSSYKNRTETHNLQQLTQEAKPQPLQ